MWTREQKREYNKKYREEHKDYYREHSKNWYKTHPEQIRKSKRKYRLSHLKQSREGVAKWKREHPEQVGKEVKKYRLKYPEKCRKAIREWGRKHPERIRIKNANRRKLGFDPLNEKFDGAVGHHIDFEIVVYIPRELHISVAHNVRTGLGMTEINTKVFEWLESSMTETGKPL